MDETGWHHTTFTGTLLKPKRCHRTYATNLDGDDGSTPLLWKPRVDLNRQTVGGCDSAFASVDIV
jgi:hypothetical protein